MRNAGAARRGERRSEGRARVEREGKRGSMDIVTRVEKVREALMSCTERTEEERRNGRMLWMMTMQHEQRLVMQRAGNAA